MGFVAFPEGASNKVVSRCVAHSVRDVFFDPDYIQIIFLKINPTLLAGHLLGSVRSFLENLFDTGANLCPPSEPIHGLRASIFIHLESWYARMMNRVVGQYDLFGLPLGSDTYNPTFWTRSAHL